MFKSRNKRNDAGQQQESEVAYQLDRGLKGQKCAVIHDLRITDGEYNAQIDHLIIHKYGFIIIESKSIKGSVSVNEQGEWSRSVFDKWQGMASPIKQVEMQYKMLNVILSEAAPQILIKILGKQTYFGCRKRDIVIAISSDAIFDRKNVPNDVSDKVFKTEFVSEQVIKLIKAHDSFFTTDPAFSKSEFAKLCEYLIDLKHQTENRFKEPLKLVASQTPKTNKTRLEAQKQMSQEQTLVKCKSCLSSNNLSGRYGKYGYYVTCECGANTSMKVPCPSCEAPTIKIKKNGDDYTGRCSSCEGIFQVGTFKGM